MGRISKKIIITGTKTQHMMQATLLVPTKANAELKTTQSHIFLFPVNSKVMRAEGPMFPLLLVFLPFGKADSGSAL